MAKPSIQKPKRVCQVEGCEEKHRAGGYCKNHYWQMWRHGKILNRTKYDPNEIIIKGDIAEIVLYNHRSEEVARTIIDTEDVEKIKNYKWCVSEGRVLTYSRGKYIKIQHVIMGIKSNKEKHLDHRDIDGLNNRKVNLRFCTQKENNRNRRKNKNNTSGYKGVFKNRSKWATAIWVNNKKIHLGTFKDKVEAARVYNKAAIRYHGSFACLNEI